MPRLILLLALVAASLTGQQIKPPPGAQVDWGNPINDGLVAWWLLNEGAGQSVQDLVHQRIGNLIDFDVSASWKGTDSGGGLHLDGGNDYVKVVDYDPLAGTGSGSLAIWGNPLGNAGHLGGWNGDGFNTGAFSIRTETQQFRFYIWAGTNSNFAITDTSHPTGNMRFFVLTYDGATARAYLDGIEGNSISITGFIKAATFGQLLIGANGAFTTNQFHNGAIDGAMVFDRALTALEVQELFHNPYGGILNIIERLTRWFLTTPAGKIFVIITN